MNSVQEKEIGQTMIQSLDTDKLQPLDKSLRQELVCLSMINTFIFPLVVLERSCSKYSKSSN